MRTFLAVSIRGLNVEAFERNFSIKSSICHSLFLSEKTTPPPVVCSAVIKNKNHQIQTIINES